jgi:hypothetical protein
MIRKNGSRAWKSARFPTAVIEPPRLIAASPIPAAAKIALR